MEVAAAGESEPQLCGEGAVGGSLRGSVFGVVALDAGKAGIDKGKKPRAQSLAGKPGLMEVRGDGDSARGADESDGVLARHRAVGDVGDGAGGHEARKHLRRGGGVALFHEGAGDVRASAAASSIETG